VLAFFVGIVSPFLLSKEVGDLYERLQLVRAAGALDEMIFEPGGVVLVEYA